MEESFLLQCKQNYIEGITPSNSLSYEKKGYKKLVEISKKYFETNQYRHFAGYFLEGQYFISLWAAHMLIEYGHPDNDLYLIAINIIKEFSNNPLAPQVAKEENLWLIKNADKLFP